MEFPEMNLAYEDYINGFGPGDFFLLYRYCKEDNIPPNAIAAELQLAGWDPYIFSGQIHKLLPKVNEMSDGLKNYIFENSKNLEQNFYRMPGESDAYFYLGVFLQNINKHEEALQCFAKSLLYYGDNFATYYNTGLSYFYLNRHQDALYHLKRAEILEQGSSQAKQLVDEIELKMKS